MTSAILNYAIGTLAALFPIANPIGAVPIFYSLTATDSRQERRKQAQRTAISVILILAVFLVGGRAILEFFGISLDVLRIAGGLLVGHAAWELVASKPRLMDAEQKAGAEKEDVSFTPMATPLIAGPGSIGVIIGLSTRMSQLGDYLGCAIGIVLFGILLYVCLVLGETLLLLLGRNGMGALNRILGFFILAVAKPTVGNRGTISC
ncbi:MarC family protein [Chamaesiphon polymorphus]|uniref:MarC family protein n=1 Tax=Chamaesiphon polymorphus TaxID=2107691 RepID=UPI001FECDDDF|nr:MarC family protein [Chamaesiphon polymorphus]